MRIGNLNVVSPKLIEEPFNQAEMFGAATWLWLHSGRHKMAPIDTLATLLLPAITHGQFVLVSDDTRPLFYAAWADFSEEAEARYLKNSPERIRPEDWNSGERGWVLDFVAPFGRTAEMNRILRAKIFTGRCVRSLYHRGSEKGLCVKDFHGIAVLPEEARHWFATHPVARPKPTVAATPILASSI